jgi:flagellar export protein FliJ
LKGPKFRYTLEPILQTRTWDRDALLSDLGKINETVTTQCRTLAHLEQEITAVASHCKDNMSSADRFGIERLRIATTYLGDLTGRRAEEKNKLFRLEEERDRVAEQLTRSQKALDAVESHKDETRLVFRNAQAAQGIKELDDHWAMLQQHSGKP